ncbi:hypothetical protein [Streptomyces sp. NBC_00094]|uniref:hypothetical protein n=1 Tax=Streptomyces sp. NBC_00094 TaxID=2903620 RepID=UPI002259BD50|nr:hypothetical protein [Streptomyces sp. NBC_00094]MCX5394416.1 hypothetical protein [Streptomyces sp. NBC_00094]
MPVSPAPGAQDRYPGPNQRIKDDLDRLIDELLLPSDPDHTHRPSHGPALPSAARPHAQGNG